MKKKKLPDYCKPVVGWGNSAWDKNKTKMSRAKRFKTINNLPPDDYARGVMSGIRSRQSRKILGIDPNDKY